jgi:zinc D-Ala-D-Ala dipeptidase
MGTGPRRAAICMICVAGALGFASAAAADELPQGFVYLRDVAPSIAQDMRYAAAGNFTGKPVPGYGAAECVLERKAAQALAGAQVKAQSLGYSLKVYDCYRPVRAVRAFVAWAKAAEDGRTKGYYPRLAKSQLVPEYIAAQSGHSTGLAVDLTIGAAGAPAGGEGANCTIAGPDAGSLDMGTAFDCFDTKANTASPAVTPAQAKNRALLVRILEGAGFKNYAAEWWHFLYPGSAAPHDFPITPRQ